MKISILTKIANLMKNKKFWLTAIIAMVLIDVISIVNIGIWNYTHLDGIYPLSIFLSFSSFFPFIGSTINMLINAIFLGEINNDTFVLGLGISICKIALVFFILSYVIQITPPKKTYKEIFIIAIRYLLPVLLLIDHIFVIFSDESYFHYFLILLFVYCVFYNIKYICHFIRHKNKYSQKGKKAALTALSISIIATIVFATNVSNTTVMQTVGYESTPSGYHTIYNKDGTKKHDKYGNVETEIEYDRTPITQLVLNYMVMLYPIISLSALKVGQKKQKELNNKSNEDSKDKLN